MRDILVEDKLFHVNLKNKDLLNKPTGFFHTWTTKLFVKSGNFELQGKIK
jgi:hypothetical protein